MRGRFWRSAGFVAAGAVLGTLAGQLLAHQFPPLRQQTVLEFHPSADWSVIRYSIDVTLRVNWLTLAGAVAGYFVGRRAR